MIHLDLFSGIGGFAYAADQVWPDCEHIFCEIEPFCQKVLKKHWPDAPICDDIRRLNGQWITANTRCKRQAVDEKQADRIEQCNKVTANTIGELRHAAITTAGSNGCDNGQTFTENVGWQEEISIDILTGGFPCQPFSVAGKQRGKDDDRFLWPEMLRVIKEVRPRWVIGENVAGFVNMALDECCADLELEGYKVQPYIIPACAINAPHRRDRVWIIAKSRCQCGQQGRLLTGKLPEETGSQSLPDNIERPDKDVTDSESRGTRKLRKQGEAQRPQSSNELLGIGSGTNSYANPEGLQGWQETRNISEGRQGREQFTIGQNPEWDQDWLEVAAELCGVDDGLPAELDGLKLSKGRHRTERLKALGNAIVPQIAMVIMQAIKETDNRAEKAKEKYALLEGR